MKRRRGILVPSAEWVRLQFAPRNTHHCSALFHTGRFDMKFQVQRRQMRSQHEDAKYVYHQQLYAKEFAICFKDFCSFISSDDKVLISVGEPGNPISMGVHCHNASLGPGQSGTFLGTLDHDWKITGIISSVNLFTDILELTSTSFFSLKERVF